MNLKSMRKSYLLLSQRERLSLLHAAFCRGDESEAKAIHAASPKADYRASDLSFLMQQIVLLNQFVLLERINSADIALDTLTSMSKVKKPEEKKRMLEGTGLSAYLYVVTTDGWRKACNEFGISAEEFHKWQAKYFFIAKRLENYDEILRDLAYTEEEVMERFPNGKTVECVSKNYFEQLRQIEMENQVS